MHAWNLHIDFDIETSQEDKVTDSYNPRNGVGNGHESGLGDTPGTQPTEPLPSSSFPYYPTGQNSEGSGQRGNDPDGRRPSWPGQADGSERGQARPGGTEALSPFSPFAARPEKGLNASVPPGRA